MDDPTLDVREHRHALRTLALVNRLSLAARRVWRDVVALHHEGVSPVRVLDVACGGGDVLAALARRAQRAGIEVALAGCDVSEVALEEALRRVERAGRAQLLRLNVVEGDLPAMYDLVCCSLFLHHLTDADAATLLRRMACASVHRMLVQDLRRTLVGEALAWTTLRIATTSRVARADGPASVRAAFTLEEARELCVAADLVGAEVRACWPQRFSIRWRRAA
jgi:2-polyprenyl-3-methyl-5-hydroxy-6-metoxy-1,4-benzoquinol methylase